MGELLAEGLSSCTAHWSLLEIKVKELAHSQSLHHLWVAKVPGHADACHSQRPLCHPQVQLFAHSKVAVKQPLPAQLLHQKLAIVMPTLDL